MSKIEIINQAIYDMEMILHTISNGEENAVDCLTAYITKWKIYRDEEAEQ